MLFIPAVYLCTPTFEGDPTSKCECSTSDLPSAIVSLVNRTRVGDIMTYTCQKDYIMVGDDEVACWFNGTRAVWEMYDHSCVKRPVWNSPKAGEYANVKISENTMPDSSIYSLAATTGDGNTSITYGFIKQTPSKPFLFDLFGNQVKVAPDAILDIDFKDSPRTFILHFRAIDNRYPYSEGKVAEDTFVIVTITDFDDNAPKFTRASYSATIDSDLLPGSSVLAVTATDADVTSPNNLVLYSFIDQDHWGYFDIGALDGVLNLIKKPDFKSFRMTIKARSGGPSTFVASTRVTIYVNSVSGPGDTTAKPVQQTGKSDVTVQKSGNSNWTIAGIVIGVIVVTAVCIVVGVLYKRHLSLKKLNVRASFRSTSGTVSVENNTVTNSNYIDDNSFRPAERNSTNECQPGADLDRHYDRDFLTTDSWQREKERVKF